jgi:Uma2 family endonuclease
MSSAKPKALVEVAYEEAAQAYLRSLPLEHFMEATAQATQRKITVQSLDLVQARRPEVQVFNELLVQYPRPGQRQPGQVVPDNMVVVCDQPVRASTSFNVPLEPVGPFWVLEYVSKGNKRKDYEDNFNKYERELKVPYYLLFYADTQDLTLYRRTKRKYVAVPPNEQGRHPIPELDLEMALIDGWVRFWYQGQLLPLAADLQRELDEARRRLAREKRRANREKRRADEEKQRADEEKQRADEEKQRADEEKQRADEEKQRADEEKQRGDNEAANRRKAEREAAELRARLEQLQARSQPES